jgi:hypothetical protein
VIGWSHHTVSSCRTQPDFEVTSQYRIQLRRRKDRRLTNSWIPEMDPDPPGKVGLRQTLKNGLVNVTRSLSVRGNESRRSAVSESSLRIDARPSEGKEGPSNPTQDSKYPEIKDGNTIASEPIPTTSVRSRPTNEAAHDPKQDSGLSAAKNSGNVFVKMADPPPRTAITMALANGRSGEIYFGTEYDDNAGFEQEEETPDSLCQMCRYIFNHLGEMLGKRLPFHSNTSLMMNTARRGCPLCGQFLQILESSGVWEGVEVLGITVEKYGWSGSSYWHLTLHCKRSAVSSAPVVLVTSVEKGASESLCSRN